MHKLEEVLRAEETARRTVADAHDRAAALVRDAEDGARKLASDARSAAASEAEAIRERLVTEAQDAAAEIAVSDSADRMDPVPASRIDRAAAAALAELMR